MSYTVVSRHFLQNCYKITELLLTNPRVFSAVSSPLPLCMTADTSSSAADNSLQFYSQEQGQWIVTCESVIIVLQNSY